MGKSFTGYVYRFYHTASGKSYVGSTVKLESRRREHLRALRKGEHHCVYFQRAWDKHGESAFAFEVLEEVIVSSDTELRTAENTYFSRFALYNTAPAAGTTLGMIQTRRRGSKSPLVEQAHIDRIGPDEIDITDAITKTGKSRETLMRMARSGELHTRTVHVLYAQKQRRVMFKRADIVALLREEEE